MDKILSTRLSETVLKKMESVTRSLGISKREFLEDAISLHVERLSCNEGGDIWAETLGAWRRTEIPAMTAGKIRAGFRKSFARHQEEG